MKPTNIIFVCKFEKKVDRYIQFFYSQILSSLSSDAILANNETGSLSILKLILVYFDCISDHSVGYSNKICALKVAYICVFLSWGLTVPLFAFHMIYELRRILSKLSEKF